MFVFIFLSFFFSKPYQKTMKQMYISKLLNQFLMHCRRTPLWKSWICVCCRIFSYFDSVIPIHCVMFRSWPSHNWWITQFACSFFEIKFFIEDYSYKFYPFLLSFFCFLFLKKKKKQRKLFGRCWSTPNLRSFEK